MYKNLLAVVLSIDGLGDLATNYTSTNDLKSRSK